MSKKRHAQRLGRRPLADLAAVRRQAMSLLVQGNIAEAQRLYTLVQTQQPDDFDANHMLGVIALRRGLPDLGITLIQKAVRLNPNHAAALGNLGTAYLHAHRPEEALHAYEQALKLEPGFVGVLSNLSGTLKSLGRWDSAAESFERLAAVAPKFEFAAGDAFYARRCASDWTGFDAYCTKITAGVAAGHAVDRPFSFLSVSSSGAHQLQCARAQAAIYMRQGAQPLRNAARYAHDKIRVAYVSADFRGHVVMNLMKAIFLQHDRSRFHVTGVSLTQGDDSELRHAAKSCFDHFLDAASMSDEAIADALRAAETDIVVDLNGYTQGCRAGIFARRPAPVQVNFLGYPGTMGAPFMDYLIADAFVIPDSHREFYSEHIVRLPHCFQPGIQRTTAMPATSRSAAGLPEDAIVLCCHNNSYKLNPAMFELWSQVLTRAPQCVLWLLTDSQVAQHRLRAAATSRGISADRLLFASRVPYAHHMSRLGLADLFLDTMPFNAGATAADALWAGLPVLTCPGEAFASRMAGSLLHAAGVPSLVAESAADYVERAVELVNDQQRLLGIKTRLTEARHEHALFDSPAYCRHLEAAFIQMSERAARGDKAADLSIGQLGDCAADVDQY